MLFNLFRNKNSKVLSDFRSKIIKEKLKTATLPNEVTSLDSRAFINCTVLENLFITKFVTSNNAESFSKCSNLKTITVDSDSEHFTSIDGVLFSKDLKTIICHPCRHNSSKYIIPSSVETIGAYAFSNSTELSSIEIPENVVTIEDYSFYKCDELISIVIPTNTKIIGNHAFHDCILLESITISSSVSTIGSMAFYNCSNLRSILIPSSVISIGESVFVKCSSLLSLSVDTNNPKYSSQNGNLFSNDMQSILFYAPNPELPIYRIPSTVKEIATGAFSFCSTITAITDNSKLINDDKTNKTIIILPTSITTIDGSAFSNCSNLTFVKLPSNITSIGNLAFDNCINLTNIIIPSSVVSIGESAFSHTKISSIILPPYITSIENNTFTSCSNLISITIPSNVKRIDDSAFSECKKLESITFLSNIESIGNAVFSYCNLTSISIPSSTSIGNCAFYHNRNLTTFSIHQNYFRNEDFNLEELPDQCEVSFLSPS